MYLLETPEHLQVAFSSLLDDFYDIMRKVLLLFTTFFASIGLFSANGQEDNTGVQAQYLLGLGKYRVVVVDLPFYTLMIGIAQLF